VNILDRGVVIEVWEKSNRMDILVYILYNSLILLDILYNLCIIISINPHYLISSPKFRSLFFSFFLYAKTI